MKNNCPECGSALVKKTGNYTTRFEPIVTVLDTEWQECPGCSETVLSTKLAQEVADLVWVVKDAQAQKA